MNWSVRTGANLRKRYAAVAKDKRALYRCDVCGKESVRRVNTGIWRCKSCGAVFAGGAYTLRTEAGKVAERIIGQSQKVS